MTTQSNKVTNKLSVLIYNGDFNLPTFIKLQAKYLEKEGYNVFIMGKSNKIFPFKIDGIKCLPEPFNEKSLICVIRIISSFTQMLLTKPSTLFYYLRIYFKDYQKNPDKGKFFYFIDLIRLRTILNYKINVINVNWPTSLPKFSHYHGINNIKLICSFYGRLTNISAFINSTINELFKTYIQFADGYHADSKELALNASKFGIPYSKILVTSSPVESKLLNYPRKNANNLFISPIKIVSIGRLHWKKGHDIALKSLSFLKKHNFNFQYFIIGQGDTYDELSYIIKHLNLENNVKMLGYKPHELAMNYLYNADLFLLPSVEEGVADVAIESMALETPVLSSNLNGMKELITHKRNGFLFEKRNTIGLYKEILNILQISPEEMEDILIRAKDEVRKNRIWEKEIRKFCDFYNNLITN